MGLALAAFSGQLTLAPGQDFSGWLVRRYVDMLSDEVQELFFSLWQVAHELERRGCLARVFEFEPLETRLDALDRIAEESLWENVSLPRLCSS